MQKRDKKNNKNSESIMIRFKAWFKNKYSMVPDEVKGQFYLALMGAAFLFVAMVIFFIMTRSLKEIMFAGVALIVGIIYYFCDQLLPFMLEEIAVIEGNVVIKKASGNNSTIQNMADGVFDSIAKDFKRYFLNLRVDTDYYKIPVMKEPNYNNGDHVMVYLSKKEIRRVSNNSFQTGRALYIHLADENLEGTI